MLRECVLKLNEQLCNYKPTNDQKELLQLEQQLQYTTTEFHTLKVQYEKYIKQWCHILVENMPKNEQQRQLGSGKKSLLKLYSNEPTLVTVDILINQSVEELDKLTNLILTQPEFPQITNLNDSTIPLDRLIEQTKKFINKDTPYICKWIIEFNQQLDRFSKILDQYIHLVSKYETELQNSIQTTSDFSCNKQLKFSQDDIKRKSIEKDKLLEKESCIQCNIM